MNTKLLRQKILDLAIRGKLTQQKKSDGTTAELLAQMSFPAPTGNLAASSNKKKGKSAEPKQIIPLDKSEAPFEIPENWEWVRLGDICGYGDCDNVDVKKIENDAWILELEDIEKDSGKIIQHFAKSERAINGVRHSFKKGDILYSKLRTYLNKVLVAPEDGFCTTEIMPIKTKEISSAYLCLVLRSQYFLDYTTMCGYGVKMPRLSTADAKNGLIPLPPLAEQQRIVTAIENAFAEISEIENNRELLKKHIKQGRQKILDLAIRGKLTEQKKSDGTTKDLLAQMSFPAPTGNLVTSSSKKKGKSIEPKQIVPLDKTTAPFEIPENWEIVKYGDVVSNVSTKNYQVKTSEIKLKGSFPVVSQGQDFIDGYVDDKTKLICANENPIVLFGDHTRVVKYIDFDFVVGADGTKIIKPLKILESKYLYFATQAIVEKIEDRGYGRHFSLLSNSFLPLPPLAEQQRIVTTIEQAFAEFDAMESNL